jgi:putative sterol carrier protein
MLDRLTGRVRQLLDCEDAFGFCLKLVVKDLGCIYVDGTSYPMTVSNAEGDAEATLRISGDDLTEMLDGRLSALTAFMAGRVQVDGDLGKAMQLGRLFS